MNSKKIQLKIIILLLFSLGAAGIYYKNQVLGFPMLPEKKEKVWTVETRISFVADKGPVTVSLNMPDDSADLAVVDLKSTAEGYDFSIEKGRHGHKRAVWKKAKARGEQKLFLRATIFRRHQQAPLPVVFTPAPSLVLNEAQQAAAKSLVAKLGKQRSPLERARTLLELFNSGREPAAALLLKDADRFGGKLPMVRGIMAMAGIRAQTVKGLHLSKDSRNRKLRGYLEILDGQSWQLLNPRTGHNVNRRDFLVWQSNDESIIEVVGGSHAKLKFSTLESRMLASRAAVAAGKHSRNLLVDFSIYTLPVADQNAFKLLLLIPFGALVVVILRNLVGISTSGTFMPILIAMVFLQTSLLLGLLLFLLVVGIGLTMRSYLSHLNLLLVPRISAVLVFVIFIYVAIAVTSVKLGLEAGLQVTYFPMIIISWTIERMSILWEEEGPRDVFIQGGGSLLSAALIYLVMQNRYINHFTYSFPEVLLVLLAIIIMIGSYSGYRLSELFRFEPMVRKP